MMKSGVFDLNASIERIGVGRLAVFVLGLGFVMMIADGYDTGIITVATPAILRDWKIQPKDMGLVFSMSAIGLLIGSLFYGWLADRFGRRFTIILGTLNFGVPVLLTLWATNVPELLLLRFIGGIGAGGIVPVAYTMASDYAPRRMRSTVTVLTNLGFTVGVILTGFVAARAIPVFGWKSLFLIGGVFSLVMALVLFLCLPESILFLAIRRPDSLNLVKLVKRLLPNEVVPAGAHFVAIDPQDRQGESGRNPFLALFAGPRAVATGLLWALFLFDALALFFLSNWLPVIMEGAGVDHSTASLSISLFFITGLAGGLIIMRFLDRNGPIAMVTFGIIGGPVEIFMGTPGISQTVLLTTVALAGICIAGIHQSVYAIAVKFYPASIRGTGVSSATVFGRAGAAIAPLVGGYFLSAHMPLHELMIWAAAPCLVTAFVGIGLSLIYRNFDTPSAPLPLTEPALT
jgi:AAHS family 4-hydroxybenzoate transporter-like MFS transporter